MKSSHLKVAELKLDDPESQEAHQIDLMLLGWRNNRREMVKVREDVWIKSSFLWSKANVVGFLGFWGPRSSTEDTADVGCSQPITWETMKDRGVKETQRPPL